jgi:hypothetical protein
MSFELPHTCSKESLLAWECTWRAATLPATSATEPQGLAGPADAPPARPLLPGFGLVIGQSRERQS